jgi:mannose-6-phosphate isomerase
MLLSKRFYQIITMTELTLYPLFFTPIYQYRLWGGRHLSHLLTEPLPDGPVGEAWILSDRNDHASVVTEGLYKGYTLTQLFNQYPESIMGKLAGKFEKFPLLLKFLDAKEVLSVQVHPSDDQKEYIPKGDTGKTEAWVVLEAGKKALIYAGLKKGTDEADLRKGLDEHKVADYIHSFTPKPGDGVFIHSGTVHTLADVVVFEVQENSDTTYRLYDWDRIDAKTGKPRQLDVDKAIACIDFGITDVGPVKPKKIAAQPVLREELFNNEHFILWRMHADTKFTVGAEDMPRILICIDGKGDIAFNGTNYAIKKGDVVLLPAELGEMDCIPQGNINLLEIAIPEQ